MKPRERRGERVGEEIDCCVWGSGAPTPSTFGFGGSAKIIFFFFFFFISQPPNPILKFLLSCTTQVPLRIQT